MKDLSTVTWLVANLMVACVSSQEIENRTPPRKYDPNGFGYHIDTPLAVLKEATFAKSFDLGLSADLFICYLMRERGITPEMASELFEAALESRVGVKVPEWWRRRHTSFFNNMLSTEELPPISKTISASYAPPDSASRKSTEDSDYFLENPDLLIHLGREDELVIKSSKGTELIALKDWCPILYWHRSRCDEMYASRLRITTLEFKVVDDRLISFGALESKLFVSRYNFSKSICEISFVSLGAEEYNFINCIIGEDGMLRSLKGELIPFGGMSGTVQQP